jgi:hypothetical protein
MPTLELRKAAIPPALVLAITKQPLSFTSPRTIFHFVWNGDHEAIGVCGDGANGAYEWFIWDDDTEKLRTSDCGFGSDCTALCCGLVEAGTERANGDHSLVLTWERR